MTQQAAADDISYQTLTNLEALLPNGSTSTFSGFPSGLFREEANTLPTSCSLTFFDYNNSDSHNFCSPAPFTGRNLTNSFDYNCHSSLSPLSALYGSSLAYCGPTDEAGFSPGLTGLSHCNNQGGFLGNNSTSCMYPTSTSLDPTSVASHGSRPSAPFITEPFYVKGNFLINKRHLFV
jgi:hypothetical protein